MKKYISFFTQFFLCLFMCEVLHGNEILVNTLEGESFILNIEPEESLKGLQDKIAALSQDRCNDLLIEISSKGKPKDYGLQMSRNQGGYLGYPRNYSIEVTPDEKADLRYILTTLANKSLIAIALAKGDIEAAGSRIDHLHPLRFLMTVFTDEELKACIRNIRGRGWIWNHFTGGLKDSLSAEMSIDNLPVVFVFDFAQIVKIDPSIILPSILVQAWDDFIDMLITHIPRTGNHDRYDT